MPTHSQICNRPARLLLLLLGWGALALAPGRAAAEAESSPGLIIHAWSNKEGLPGSSVISLIQTRDGYLWMGTLYGLVRFDGNRFSSFDDNNAPGLGSGRIVHLFEDSHTNLWVGTDSGGVARVAGGAIQNFTLGQGGHEGRLTSAGEDATGAVWLYSADARLGRFQNGKMEVLDLHLPSPAAARRIAVEKDGPLWISEYQPGQTTGLFAFRPANFHPPSLAIDQSLPARQIDFILARQREGGTWRLMDGLVQKWNTTTLEKNLGPSPWGSSPVTSAVEDPEGNLIVGTLGCGVFWFKPDGHCRQISKAQGLSSDFVLSLCMDRSGNLWVGTDGEGVNRIKRKIFTAASEQSPRSAQSVSADDQGRLWTAFNAQGLTRQTAGSAQDFGVGRGSNAWTVLADRQQQVWAGTRDEGLFQLRTNLYDHFESASGSQILGPWIYALYQDRRGRLWAGTQNGLACRETGRDWKLFTPRDGLSDKNVRAIAEDPDGSLWVGTENGGLNRFRDGKFTGYPAQKNGLPGDDIACLCVDSEGVLWVGTAGHGLGRFINGKGSRYSTEHGLASNFISYLIDDTAGNLWLGSNLGLMRVPRQSLNDFAEGKVRTLSCRTFVETDGLPTRECTAGSQPAACRTGDGRLWFSTTKGLASINPADLKPNSQPPTVRIESVLIGGREQKTNLLNSVWRQSVVIPPGGEQLDIHYTGLNFSAPDKVRFQYRLEGRETAWTEAGDSRVAHYGRIEPGRYRFHVIAYNEDGLSDENGSVLKITVRPQFWQTGWFRTGILLGLAGLVAAGVRYLSTQKLRRELQLHEEQEALEKERARIARDLHDQLGANLTQVALLGEMSSADKHQPAEIEAHAQQISQTARQTTRALDEIVWAVNPSNDTLEGLTTYACKYAQEYLALAGLRYRAEVPAQLPATPLPPEVRHHAFLAFKEAVNNVVKHAQASEAWIRLHLDPAGFTFEIEDNGRGLASSPAPQNRNGLRNMKKRMEEIGGRFSIEPGSQGGTRVRLIIPLKTH